MSPSGAINNPFRHIAVGEIYFVEKVFNIFFEVNFEYHLTFGPLILIKEPLSPTTPLHVLTFFSLFSRSESLLEPRQNLDRTLNDPFSIRFFLYLRLDVEISG